MSRLPNSKRPSAKRNAIPGEGYLATRAGSGDWQVDFSIEGRRFRGSSGTSDKAAAAAFALKWWNEAWNEIKLGIKPRLDMTLNEACVRYYEEVCKGTPYGERSQRYNMNLLLQALGEKTLLADLDDERISRLVHHFKTRKAPSAGFKDGLSAATVNRYITTLSVICKRAKEVWGVEVGGWNKVKHAQAEPKGRETFLDHAQARKLLDNLCGHARPIVLFDLMTGLRKGNAIGIQWENVSLELSRVVMVQKGSRRLAITLPPAAVALLASVQPDPEKRVGPVWVFGNPQTPCICSHCKPKRNHGTPVKSIKRAFATAVAEAGLGAVRFHDLRHTFASWVLAESGDLKLVQDALQHSDIATTARYAHLMPGRKEAAIAGAVAGLVEPVIVPTESDRKAG